VAEAGLSGGSGLLQKSREILKCQLVTKYSIYNHRGADFENVHQREREGVAVAGESRGREKF